MVETKLNETGSTRHMITQKATEMFLADGFAGTPMRAIAEGCDIKKASLYYHFPSKEALFAACVTDGYSQSLADIKTIASDNAQTVEAKFTCAMHLLYDTIESPVGRMSPLIAEVSRTFPSVAQSFHRDYIMPQQDTIWAIIDEGVKEGSFAAQDPRQLHHLIFGPIVTLSLSREMFTSFEDLDTHFPVGSLRDGHVAALLKLLRREG